MFRISHKHIFTTAAQTEGRTLVKRGRAERSALDKGTGEGDGFHLFQTATEPGLSLRSVRSGEKDNA